eukprot:symbB.v1.2.036241.t1/scaffold5071.1/size31245/1
MTSMSSKSSFRRIMKISGLHLTLDGEYEELPPEKVVNKEGTEIQLIQFRNSVTETDFRIFGGGIPFMISS